MFSHDSALTQAFRAVASLEVIEMRAGDGSASDLHTQEDCVLCFLCLPSTAALRQSPDTEQKKQGCVTTHRTEDLHRGTSRLHDDDSPHLVHRCVLSFR